MAEILQITDIHLYTDDNAKLLGINTTQSFQAVLNLALNQHPSYAAMVLTGDLIQDDKTSSYTKLKQMLKNVPAPIYWLAGNHDTDALFKGQFAAENIFKDKAFSLDNWRIILLNTRYPNHVEGLISKDELARLKLELEQNLNKHVLICMHHNPVTINSAWLEPLKVINCDQFWHVVDQFKQVRAVLWGHVHQEFAGQRAQVRLMCSPSTCIQFKPLSKNFKTDSAQPGYRWLQLHADGSLSTRVERLAENSFDPDLAAKGY